MRALAMVIVWTATASAEPCHENRRCWWGDGLIIGVMGSALVAEHLDIPNLSTSGTAFNATSSAPYHAELAPESRRSMWTLGFRSGVLWRGPTLIYGVEFAYGAAIAGPTVTASVLGTPPVTNSGGQLFDAASVIGAHHRLGHVDVGGLLALGVRLINENPAFPDGFSTCPGGVLRKGCIPYVQNLQDLVEPRGRVEWWIAPHVTLGVAGGLDLAHHGESVALELQVHLLPYDGT